MKFFIYLMINIFSVLLQTTKLNNVLFTFCQLKLVNDEWMELVMFKTKDYKIFHFLLPWQAISLIFLFYLKREDGVSSMPILHYDFSMSRQHGSQYAGCYSMSSWF